VSTNFTDIEMDENPTKDPPKRLKKVPNRHDFFLINQKLARAVRQRMTHPKR